MEETFLNSSHKISLESALAYYQKLGVAVEVNDGKDVTFRIEGEVEQ